MPVASRRPGRRVRCRRLRPASRRSPAAPSVAARPGSANGRTGIGRRRRCGGPPNARCARGRRQPSRPAGRRRARCRRSTISSRVGSPPNSATRTWRAYVELRGRAGIAWGSLVDAARAAGAEAGDGEVGAGRRRGTGERRAQQHHGGGGRADRPATRSGPVTERVALIRYGLPRHALPPRRPPRPMSGECRPVAAPSRQRSAASRGAIRRLASRARSSSAGSGRAEQEALAQLAAEGDEPVALDDRLHSLGHRGHAHRVGEDDGGRDDGVVLRTAARQARDERLVDLELVGHREAADVLERGVAGAEVVDGEPHAEVRAAAARRPWPLEVADEGALGDLEAEGVGRRDGGARARRSTRSSRPSSVSWRADEVDGHAEVVEAGLAAPHRGLPARLLEHLTAERDDEAGVLGDGHELVGRDRAAAGPVPAQRAPRRRRPARRPGDAAVGSAR